MSRITALLAPLALATVAGFAAQEARAHHSFAMYDQTKQETLTGKLTRFIPGANHAQLLFELTSPEGEPQRGADGQPIVWGIELPPAATIAKQGVTVKTFPLGSIVTVTLNPLRNGKPFGALANGAMLVNCGLQMPAGGCNDKTGQVFLQSRDDFGTQRVQTAQ
jgi:hypothetical protein